MEPILRAIWSRIVEYLPTITGVIVVLAVGWIAGRALGKGISKVLDRAGVDDALRKTVIGRALERSGITCVGFFDLIIRWFIYLIAIFAAVDLIRIEVVSRYMSMIVQYIPSLIAGVLVLLIGFIVVDFISDFVKTVGKEAKIEYSTVFADGLRLFLYTVVIILALEQMKIDVSILYVFVNAFAWGIGIGVCVGLGIALGWGFKDVIATSAKEWAESITKVGRKVEEVRAKGKK